ncbi:hypothetical protein ACO0RG_001756 [Hanseniaspora osmophila]
MNRNQRELSNQSNGTFESSVDSFVTANSFPTDTDAFTHVRDLPKPSFEDESDKTPIIVQGEFQNDTTVSRNGTITARAGRNMEETTPTSNGGVIGTGIDLSPLPQHHNLPPRSPSPVRSLHTFEQPLFRKPRITSSYYQPLEEARQSLMQEHHAEPVETESLLEQDDLAFNETTMDSINTNVVSPDRVINEEHFAQNISPPTSIETTKNGGKGEPASNDEEDLPTSTGHEILNNSQLDLDTEEYTNLFIVATKAFDKNVLEEEDDKQVCLSFEVDDVAFVHAIEESGWGEVTIVKVNKRGWVPLNFFTDAIKPTSTFLPKNFLHLSSLESKQIIQLRAQILSREPLLAFFSACGRFLVSPQRVPTETANEYTFDIEDINRIKAGIKKLLEKTGCISRTNALVQAKALVRKTRKRLLADWYSVALKADSCKGTTSSEKIQKLEEMIFQVIRRAFLFYSIWGIEVQAYENEKRLIKLKDRKSFLPSLAAQERPASIDLPQDVKCLDQPPMAISRLNEINNYLFTYIGLVLGRMDIIEHNPAGCEALEYVVYQIILLLRELLYISKACSTLISSKYQNSYENNLDNNLDPLLSLVSELVSAVKIFVTKTLQETATRTNSLRHSMIKFENQSYSHTAEASDFIRVLSQMTGFISNAISSCNNYLRIIGDFQLGDEKEYSDFKSSSIAPEKFVKICSTSILDEIKRLDLKAVTGSPETADKSFARFSTIRAGEGSLSNQLRLTNEGGEFLRECEAADYNDEGLAENDQKSFLRNSVFEQFTVPDENLFDQQEREALLIMDREAMQNELVYDKFTQDLLGGSFRALVFHLTDEVHKPDEFFTTSFLINFKSFGTSKELLTDLFARFDTENKSYKSGLNKKSEAFSSWASQLKHRRKLVVKVIKLWLESYWDHIADFSYLPTLMNFFNECVSNHLPIESRNMIEIIAKLMTVSPDSSHSQLISRSIKVANINSVLSKLSSISTNDSDQVNEDIVDDFDLASNAGDSLPVPVAGLGTSNLLSLTHAQECKKLVEKYRDLAFRTSERSSLDKLISTWFYNVKNNQRIQFSNHEIQFCDMNAMEVAKQLTLIEARLFAAIDPMELLNGRFLEKNKSLGQAPNVSRLITFTNALSNYVIESIVSPLFSLKIKQLRIRQWMKISLSCLYFKNFNSLASIMIALQSHVISRLTTVWEGFTTKDHKLLEFLMKIIHPNQNYKVYRKKLAIFVQQAKNMYMNNGDNNSALNGDKANSLIVPFFNLFLQDLTMINEGNNNYRNPESFRPNKIINIDKYFKVTKIVQKVQELQVFIIDNLDFEEYTDTRDSLYLIGKETIKSLPVLQEFVLYELWRVNLIYTNEPDRGYDMSLKMLPKI